MLSMFSLGAQSQIKGQRRAPSAILHSPSQARHSYVIGVLEPLRVTSPHSYLTSCLHISYEAAEVPQGQRPLHDPGNAKLCEATS